MNCETTRPRTGPGTRLPSERSKGSRCRPGGPGEKRRTWWPSCRQIPSLEEPSWALEAWSLKQSSMSTTYLIMLLAVASYVSDDELDPLAPGHRTSGSDGRDRDAR